MNIFIDSDDVYLILIALVIFFAFGPVWAIIPLILGLIRGRLK